MMAITTKSSTSVKPRRRKSFFIRDTSEEKEKETPLLVSSIILTGEKKPVRPILLRNRYDSGGFLLNDYKNPLWDGLLLEGIVQGRGVG